MRFSHSFRRSLLLFVSLACSGAPLAAQGALAEGAVPPALLERLFADAGPWVAADAASERLEALRDGYKVTADAQGFCFVPFRGAEAPRSWPWRWSTARVRRGAVELAGDAAGELQREGELAVCEHGTWRERWELRAEGLEQSWVFDELPAGSGDLEIEGRIESALRCAPRALAVAPLEFVDEGGEPALRYGTALAIDARGEELPVPTAWDGERVRLVVDASWLERAALPIVVDPLTSPVAIAAGFTARPLSSVSVAFSMPQSQGSLLIALTRVWSATDHDVAAYACELDFTLPRLLMQDLSTSASDTRAVASYAAGPDRWIVGLERSFTNASGAFTSVRAYLHDRLSTTVNSGTARELSGAPLASYTALAIGGTDRHGIEHRVLFAFQSDLTTTRENTNASRVRGAVLDAAQQSFGSLLELSGTVGSNYDRETPTVADSTLSSDPWLVVWSERDRNILQDDFDLLANSINRSGVPDAPWLLANGFSSRHLVAPRLAGISYRRIVMWGETDSLSSSEPVRLAARAFEWNTAIVTPRFQAPARIVASGVGSGGRLLPTSLVFDRETTLHAHGAYLRRETGAARDVAHYVYLGSTGGVIEDLELFASPTESAVAPALSFDILGEENVVVYGSATVAGAVLAARFGRSGQAAVIGLEGGCGPGNLGTSRPDAGCGQFTINLDSLQPGATAVLLLSQQSISLPLDGLGLIGCGLRADLGTTYLASLTTQASQYGLASTVLALPDVPVFYGDFVAQYAYLQPGLNALGIGVSDGVLVRVR